LGPRYTVLHPSLRAAAATTIAPSSCISPVGVATTIRGASGPDRVALAHQLAVNLAEIAVVVAKS